jgi:cell division protein FtsW (lipid II flippase)
MRQLPRFLHALTAMHAVGAGVCFVMALGSAASDNFRASLAASGGSAIMVASFRQWTWAFLGFVGTVLATLAYSSWRVRSWAWPMTLVVYGVGVLGSLWQVSVGIPQGWVAASVNAAVFIYASTPGVRRAYTGR